MVYFAWSQGYVKIGYTVDVNTRVAALSTASPEPIYLLAAFEGDRETEKAWHTICRAWRVRGEWFTADRVIDLLEAYYHTELPRTETAIRYADLADICETCEEDTCSHCTARLRNWPLAVHDKGNGWVKAIYQCANGHRWSCGWDKRVVRYL